LNETEIEMHKSFLLSIKPEEFVFNTYTFNNETLKKETLLSIYHSEDIKDFGFRITNSSCWAKFETMMHEEKQVKLIVDF
jgi:hypothetical protein